MVEQGKEINKIDKFKRILTYSLRSIATLVLLSMAAKSGISGLLDRQATLEKELFDQLNALPANDERGQTHANEYLIPGTDSTLVIPGEDENTMGLDKLADVLGEAFIPELQVTSAGNDPDPDPEPEPESEPELDPEPEPESEPELDPEPESDELQNLLLHSTGEYGHLRLFTLNELINNYTPLSEDVIRGALNQMDSSNDTLAIKRVPENGYSYFVLRTVYDEEGNIEDVNFNATAGGPKLLAGTEILEFTSNSDGSTDPTHAYIIEGDDSTRHTVRPRIGEVSFLRVSPDDIDRIQELYKKNNQDINEQRDLLEDIIRAEGAIVGYNDIPFLEVVSHQTAVEWAGESPEGMVYNGVTPFSADQRDEFLNDVRNLLSRN